MIAVLFGLPPSSDTCWCWCVLQHQRALVVALRDIAAGEELYVDYGKWYWAKAKGNRI